MTGHDCLVAVRACIKVDRGCLGMVVPASYWMVPALERVMPTSKPVVIAS